MNVDTYDKKKTKKKKQKQKKNNNKCSYSISNHKRSICGETSALAKFSSQPRTYKLWRDLLITCVAARVNLALSLEVIYEMTKQLVNGYDFREEALSKLVYLRSGKWYTLKRKNLRSLTNIAIFFIQYITKTCLFKYTEFFFIFFIFLLKT